MADKMSDQFLVIWLTRWLILIGLFRLFARGTDYLTGDNSTIGMVEIGSDIPQLVWGIICLVCVSIVIFGLIRNNLRIQAIGCFVAAATNFGFASVSAMKVFSLSKFSEDTGSFSLWSHWIAKNIVDVHMILPIDDWRFPSDYISSAATWVVLGMALMLLNAILTSREENDGEY